MRKLVLSDGTEIEIEERVGDSAFAAQGATADEFKAKLSEMSKRGAQVLSEAIDNMKEELRNISPHELEVSIGVSVGKKGSIVIASASAEASLSIKAKWKLKD